MNWTCSELMPPTAISRDEVLKFETFLLDADGTLWEENEPIPGAVDFISTLRDAEKRVFIVSNNPNRSMDEYLSRIARMGFHGITKENVINPGLVMGAYFRDRPDYARQPVYLLGNENVKNTLESIGNVRCFGTGPLTPEKSSTQNFSVNPKAVVSSMEPYLSYTKIMKAVDYLKRSEVEFLVTDEDYALPYLGPGAELPRSGHPSRIIQAISGRIPKVFGKPHKPMADYLKSKGHIDPAKTVMFGDRLETDIQFANENGFTSCLVLTGVHSLEDVKKAEQRGAINLIPKHIFSFLSA
ncbi:Haloacid dehalogenase hydrolase domain containing protein [Trichostrongylus colubriformis]|uniref:Haloacid dehalogenase hydrolase domain containing protein n=1 Tax=Trichostrongylus colubriformis TaxID=6319 RepID=A0AAN8IJH1_TRICO